MSERRDRAFAAAAVIAVILPSLAASEAVSINSAQLTAPARAVSAPPWPPSPSILAAGMRYVGGDEFNGTGVDQRLWGQYSSAGSGGYGVRRPRQITQSSGVLTITCTANGTTGGMMYRGSQMYGLWEVRLTMSAASSNVHPVLLLWPANDDWPAGGEIDYLEVADPTRQSADGFLHYGSDNSQTSGSAFVDLTRYNVFSVKWTDAGVYYYVNNVLWFSDTDRSHLPPGPMQPTLQLDYTGGTATPGTMTVDWIRIYQ
jgi:hypothetical protein